MTAWKDELPYIDGFYVGQLNNYESEIFERAVSEGLARRVYEGVGGLMGLAKVQLINQTSGGINPE